MPVLKRENSRPLMNGAIVLDMGDLDRQGKQIIAQAREAAARILDKAQAEAKEITSKAADIGRVQGLEQGMNEGREQGWAEGRADVVQELKPRLEKMLDSWSAALDQWEADRNDMLLRAKQDVLTLALEMGRRVALRTIAADPNVVLDQVAEALAHLTRPTAVTIAIHPEDRDLIEDALPNLLSRFSKCAQATIRDEPSMQRGGCVLSTGSGEIDASIETQLDRIIEALLPASGRSKANDA